MKTIITFILLLFTYLQLPSQNYLPNDSLYVKIDKNFDFKIIDDILWTRDSIYYYIGSNDAWKLNKKYKVLSRDHKGRILSAIETVLDSNSNWINSTLTKVNYFGNDILNDSIVLNWESKVNIWQDTLQYLKKNQNGNILEKIESYWGFNGISNNPVRIFNQTKYKYNDNFQEIYHSNFKKNIDGNWEILSESTSYYNTSNFLTEQIYHRFPHFDYFDYISEKYTLYKYIPDIKNNIIEKKIQEKENENEDWINSKKYFYEYDTSNLKTNEIWLEWNKDMNKWENSYLGHYQYNDFLLVNETWGKWDQDSFMLCCRTLYNYNNDEKLIHKLGQNRNNEIDTWYDKKEYNYDFNEFGENILYSYIENGLKIRKFENEFDNENKFIKLIYQIGDENNKWENVQRILATYFNEENRKEFLDQRWNKETLEWYNFNKSTYAYDYNENLVQKIYLIWNIDENDWRKNRKEEYFWSQLNTNKLENLKFANPPIFPNPASNFISISEAELSNISRVEIFSDSGKLLKSQIEIYSGFLDISDLKNGMYFLRIINSQGQQIIKFVVNK